MKLFVECPEVFLHRDVVDFRKSINGLVGIVEGDLERDVYTGVLFVFCNKARDKLKILYWNTLVTGGGSGIGRSICLRLALKQHKILVVDLNLHAAQETVKEIINNDGQAKAYAVDVSNNETVLALFKNINKEHAIDKVCVRAKKTQKLELVTGCFEAFCVTDRAENETITTSNLH